MSRSMNQIIGELEKNPDHIMFLYRWLGITKYTWEEREGLCQYLLKNVDNLKGQIKVLSYAGEKSGDPKGWVYKDYRSDNRNGFSQDYKSTKKNAKPLRGEEYLAMDFFRMGREEENKIPKIISGLGYILDYQMPIGGTNTLLLVKNDSIYDKNSTDYKYGISDPDKKDDPKLKNRLFKPGKCDLIAYDNGHFIIYELKGPYNQESMLRAVMEAYTYGQMLNKELATKSFRKHYNDLIPEGEIPWEARLLLCKNKMQYNEYVENEDSYLRKLMEELKITPVWYTTDVSICIK